jgi:hypothetical protein
MAKTVDLLDTPCMICGGPGYYGFGLPPRPILWACATHRATVDGLWRPSPYVGLPRTGRPARVPPSAAAKAVRKLTR